MIHDKCLHCGRPEGEHCVFEPVNAPDSCVCDPIQWSDPSKIPQACGKFDGDESGYCNTCEHDKECHTVSS